MQQLGPYVLERELGRGGMGVVWRAHDPALERPVAIKVVLTALAGPEDLLRFRREAQAQARLRHPAIVGVHFVGATPSGQPYLVMDLVEGESLAERLKRDGPRAPAEAVRLVARLARAVHYAHERGVLHRDLKARNVLLDATGDPLLIDFGLAALAGREKLTATGAMVGTPGCMAPEQALGDRARVGPPADVYGLGAVLHEALTGQPPFVGPDPLSTLTAVLERPAAPPSRLRPGLDPRLDALVLRCLEKDPARRYPTADALADALEALAPRSAGPPPARRRWLAPAVVAGGLGLLVGALGGRRLAAPAPAPTPTPTPTPAPAPPAPVATAPPPPGPRGASEGAAALAALREQDYERSRAHAAAALSGPGAADLAQALLARAVVSGLDRRPELARADLDTALGLCRSPQLLAQRAQARLLFGDLAGAREDLAELGRSTAATDAVFVARALVLAGEAGALAAAEAAVGAADAALPADERLRARARGARGFAHLEAGQLAASRADVAAALEADPREPLALAARVTAPSDRLRSLQEALQAATTSPAPEPLLVALLLSLVAEHLAPVETATAPQLRRALEQLDRALVLAPGSRRALSLRTLLRMRQGVVGEPQGRRAWYGAALEDAERLARQDEADPSGVELLATVQAGLTFDAAHGVDVAAGARTFATLTLGLARHPRHAAFLLARTHLRANLGDAAGAEADARALLALPGLAPAEGASATAVRARLRWRRGDVRGALALIEELPDHGDHASLLAERAVCLGILRQPREALAAAERARELAPSLPQVHLAVARAHLAAGPAGVAPARAALDEALARDPAMALALSDRGLIRPPEEAQASAADLETAVRLEPWAADHQAVKGTALLNAGDLAGGDAALDEALALDPACCLARRTRARRRLQAGDARGALADLQLVTERQPWIVEPWSLLAQACLETGDPAGAGRAAERCLALQARSQVPEANAEAVERAQRVQAALAQGRR